MVPHQVFRPVVEGGLTIPRTDVMAVSMSCKTWRSASLASRWVLKMPAHSRFSGLAGSWWRTRHLSGCPGTSLSSGGTTLAKTTRDFLDPAAHQSTSSFR
jgi:hypothetical protein